MKPYVVRQGDHLRKIAFTEGFDGDTAWAHEKNAELRALRQDPSVLCPGDILYIPDEPKRDAPVAVGGSSSFSATVPGVEIAVQFCDDEGKPIRDEPCQVAVAGRTHSLTTGGDGVLRFEAPVTCPTADAIFDRRGSVFHLEIGHLDPPDTPGGEFQRLSNLGAIGHGAEEIWRALQDDREMDAAELQRTLATAARASLRRDREQTGESNGNDEEARGWLRNLHGR